MNAPFAEEPWEAEIGAMLGGLPAVEPPDGFIEGAIDHRPLRSGRTMAAWVLVAAAAVVAAVATGAVGRGEVTLEPNELADRHTAVEAGVFGTGGTGGSGYREVEGDLDAPIDPPDGFRSTSNLVADDVRVVVYERGDESFSVFVQGGELNWEALDPEFLTEIDGRRAWVEPDRSMTVVEVDGQVITVVGLAVDEVGATLPHDDAHRTVWDRAEDTAAAVARQLGFPDVGTIDVP